MEFHDGRGCRSINCYSREAGGGRLSPRVISVPWRSRTRADRATSGARGAENAPWLANDPCELRQSSSSRRFSAAALHTGGRVNDYNLSRRGRWRGKMYRKNVAPSQRRFFLAGRGLEGLWTPLTVDVASEAVINGLSLLVINGSVAVNSLYPA